MNFLINKLMDTNRHAQVKQILLDPRISVTHYPEIWSQYIERQCKHGKQEEALNMVDELKTKCINDLIVELYNRVMEKFIFFKHRTQIKNTLKIADHLIHNQVKLSYYNQVETLIQSYQFKDESNSSKQLFFEYIRQIDYVLDPNVYNFVLNLILDVSDFDTAIRMFELVFDSGLKKVEL